MAEKTRARRNRTRRSVRNTPVEQTENTEERKLSVVKDDDAADTAEEFREDQETPEVPEADLESEVDQTDPSGPSDEDGQEAELDDDLDSEDAADSADADVDNDLDEDGEGDAPVRKSRRAKGAAQAGSVDKAREEAEDESEDDDQQSLIFESKKKASKDGLRFWADRKKLIRKVAAAGSYTSTSVSAPRYMTEVTVQVSDHGDDANRAVVVTGESEYDAGQFFLLSEDFNTSADRDFIFFVDPQFLLTALEIITSPSVTLELVLDSDDDAVADLHILDATSSGQNTACRVSIPDGTNEPYVPEGLDEESIVFDPEEFLDAYAEAERCREADNATLAQVFSSVHTEDDRPFIRFAGSNRMYSSLTRSWLDEVNGTKLRKVNFHPAAISKATGFMNEGVACQIAISASNPEDNDWDDDASQSEQIVVMTTFDERDRVLSTIRLSTLVPAQNDVESLIVDSAHATLVESSVLVTVNYPQFAKAIVNASKVHGLTPESLDQGQRTVYLVLNDDEIIVRSHNINRGDFGTSSAHAIEQLDDSGKHNEDFGSRDVVALLTNSALPIIERFNPDSDDDEAVICFFKSRQRDDNGEIVNESEHFQGVILLHVDEAQEWNEDDDTPHFITVLTGSGDTSIYEDADQ